MAKNDPPLHIDMPFDEALERFIGASSKETQANIDKARRKRSPAKAADDPKVTELGSRRKPNDVRKLLGR